jgi:hypothetical protein
MHHFIAETSQLEIGTVVTFLKRAQAIYDESLNAYVKIVLRRPFMKIIVSDSSLVYTFANALFRTSLTGSNAC